MHTKTSNFRKVDITGCRKLTTIHINSQLKNVIIDKFGTIRIGKLSEGRYPRYKFLISTKEDIINERLLNLTE